MFEGPTEQELQSEAEVTGADGWEDANYFSGYNSFALQRAMLSDSHRNAAYRSCLQGCCGGRVCLDVGSGTGLLAFFAQQAGASRVYAVEASGMAYHAYRVAQDNHLSDTVHVSVIVSFFPFLSCW